MLKWLERLITKDGGSTSAGAAGVQRDGTQLQEPAHRLIVERKAELEKRLRALEIEVQVIERQRD